MLDIKKERIGGVNMGSYQWTITHHCSLDCFQMETEIGAALCAMRRREGLYFSFYEDYTHNKDT